ncbi:MAG: hypothetical protein K2X98_06500 [Alphaproteobacteria bacterium]|nr:hypothetical protein [Alphaproteobacteria bacterium]
MTITLTQATLTDFPTVEKMVPFYIYDVSRYCGWPFEGKEEGENIGYHHQRLLDNVRRYFNEAGRYPFLIKVDGELAGFVLIKKGCWTPNIDWYIGEFFILARFQGVKVQERNR